jgi:hypothetical protein
MRLMEHALGRASQDSFSLQRVRGTHLSFDELHNLREVSIRGSRLISGRFLRQTAQVRENWSASEGQAPYECLSYLKTHVKINISFSFM